MELKSTVLFVKNVHVSKEFYIRVLNLKVFNDYNVNIEFYGGLSIWQLQENHILQKFIDPTAMSKVELYFEDNSIDALWHRLNHEEVDILHPIHCEEWGQRTIRFKDPDGHIIEVGEKMDYVIRRLFNKGFSINEIKNKTGLSVDYINCRIK